MTNLDALCRCGHALREHNIVTRLKPCFSCEDDKRHCREFISEGDAFFEALAQKPPLSEVYRDCEDAFPEVSRAHLTMTMRTIERNRPALAFLAKA